MFFKLALLSAVKHYKRSIVVFVAVTVAAGIMIVIMSLLNGVTESFYDSVVPTSGHVRVDDPASEKALNPLSLNYLVPDAAQKVDAIRSRALPGVTDVEPFLRFGGLLVQNTDDDSVEPRNLAMLGMGVVQDTKFADTARDGIVEGGFLPGGEGIVISERAAALLKVGLGQGVILLVQDRNSQPWYEELKVTGLFKTESSTFDESAFYIDHNRAAEMLDAAGYTREIRVLLADRDRASDVERVLSPAFAGLRVESWEKINGTVLSLIVFVRIALTVVILMFAVVAGTIIANTVLMSVFERTREFGTLRAIGLKRRQLRGLIVAEGAVIGAAGSVAGLLLGLVGVAIMSANGFDLGGLMESVGLSRVNHPRPSVGIVAACGIAGVCVSLAATLYGARIAARRSVAESLAYV